MNPDFILGALVSIGSVLAAAVAVMWRHFVKRQKIEDAKAENMTTATVNNTHALNNLASVVVELKTMIKANHDADISTLVKAAKRSR